MAKKNADSNGVQAQSPPIETGDGRPAALIEASAEIIGIPAGSASDIFSTPEIARSQICRAAEVILGSDSTVISVKGPKGVDIHYRVSLGNEHFPAKKGILEDVLQENGVMPGFNLRQKVSRVSQSVEPIYLVCGDRVDRPVVTIMPATGGIYRDGSLIEPLEDAEDLKEISKIIAAIAQDSKERRGELDEKNQSHKEASRKKHRKTVAKLASALALAATLRFAIPPATEGFQGWNQNRIEKQADKNAANRAEKLEEAAQEKRAKDAREDRVRNFDAKFDIDKSISPIKAGSIGAGQPTDLFIDQKVPSFSAENIDKSLAQNLSGPRSIKIPGVSEDGSSTKELDMPIKVGDNFKVAHNGSPNEIVNVKFDPATDKLTIIHSTPIGASDRPATEIYIQRTNG